MENGGEMLQLCRLCLVKDDVNIPIFEEQGDIRQIFLKISSCLPVKVSREDKLPKKICDGCSYKLDMLYEFWNTSANAEKQLLSWLGEAGMNSQMTDGTISAVAQQIKPVETVVKQEEIDPSDINTEENDDDKSYMFQQKFSMDEPAGPSATVTSNDEEPPPPKRARRTAAVKAQIAMDNESDDDDDDSGEPMTKIEDESDESDGEDHEPAFVDVPSTSADDQPGPSGVGKDGVEAPLITKEPYETSATSNDLLLIRYNVIKNVSCEWCENTFKSSELLNQHKMKEHAKLMPQFECDVCNKKFPKKNLVKKHTLNVHFKIFNFDCNKCDKVFQRPGELASHQKIHQERKEVYTCHTCQKTFNCKEYLQKHCKIHDPLNKSEFICPICSKVCRYNQSLRLHMKGHTGENKVICHICGKSISKVNINEHIKTHTGEKAFKCDVCEKRFINIKALRIHKLVHMKDKPFQCNICQQKFTLKASLTAHIRSHTGEKPFDCSVCLKKFTRKTTLNYHLCKGPTV